MPWSVSQGGFSRIAIGASRFTLDGGHGLARQGKLGCERPRAGDRAGGAHRQGADVRLDEPRGAEADGCQRRSGVLVALAPEIVAQGRGVWPRAEGARAASGLRCGRNITLRGAGRRHRLPHRPAQLFFPEVRGREMGRDGPGDQRPQGYIPKMSDILRIVGETADLWFHCLIMLAHYGLRPADVLYELKRREGISGIDEKAARSESPRVEAERK